MDEQNFSDNDSRTLVDMLCLIHGDGGHYIAEHGIEKAYDAALSKYYKYRYSGEACERHSCCNCGNTKCPMNGVNCGQFISK